MALNFSDLGIPIGPEHDCPYLPGLVARERAFRIDRLPHGFYQRLMDHGWRRSGRILYKPACEGCRACVPIRVPVDEFHPNRTQRKTMRRNRDVVASVGRPVPTAEKFELFCRYQDARHSGTMCTKWEDFSAFLYDSPVPSREVTFREPDNRLIGVAIVDLESGVMSSVYNYYEPDSGRASLGSWMILWLLDFCRVTRLRWYYPGYHVEGCAKMNYKVAYRPYELGDNEGNWVRHGGEPAA